MKSLGSMLRDIIGVLRYHAVFFSPGKDICAPVGKNDGGAADPFDIIRINQSTSANLDKTIAEKLRSLGKAEQQTVRLLIRPENVGIMAVAFYSYDFQG